MKIHVDKGFYQFVMEKEDMEYNIATNSIFNAKTNYLNYISERIDDCINDKINQLNKIQSIINEKI